MAPSQPSISKSSFHYSNNTFYAETSAQQRHRRATLPELKALFHPTGSNNPSTADIEKDPVGHWFEAQLIHYGLPSSKTKAVAKTRLLDAVNSGKLEVPKEI